MDWILIILLGVGLVVAAVLLTRQLVMSRMRGELSVAEKEKEMLRQQMADAERNHQRQLEQQSRLMKEQIENATARLLTQRSEELRQGNRQQMETIVKPLQDQLQNMQAVINQNREANASNASSLRTAIESMMRQSQQLGEDAKNLTDALNNKSKVQGDWGEQILESILEESGLRRGHEYVVQNSFNDEESGGRLRPDVVVNCPDNRHIIIDSKVSLTAYVRYVGAANDEEREQAERENYDSMLQHVNELAAKEYHKVVPNSIKTVLMFVPNEGSYILALRHNPQLGQMAFKKGVVIINPTNLMLSLQLIYNLWQSERQARNVEKIIDQSTRLYDKFVTFSETMLAVGESIGKTQRAYEKAMTQLSEGKGNIVNRLDSLKKLGITTTKEIPEGVRSEE